MAKKLATQKLDKLHAVDEDEFNHKLSQKFAESLENAINDVTEDLGDKEYKSELLVTMLAFSAQLALNMQVSLESFIDASAKTYIGYSGPDLSDENQEVETEALN